MSCFLCYQTLPGIIRVGRAKCMHKVQGFLWSLKVSSSINKVGPNTNLKFTLKNFVHIGIWHALITLQTQLLEAFTGFISLRRSSSSREKFLKKLEIVKALRTASLADFGTLTT